MLLGSAAWPFQPATLGSPNPGDTAPTYQQEEGNFTDTGHLPSVSRSSNRAAGGAWKGSSSPEP